MAYAFQTYRGRNTRHRCPSCGRSHCFTYYVDNEGKALAPMVGRCDHESSCGYHYRPRDFFRDHPSLKVPESWMTEVKKAEKPLCTIDREWVKRLRSDQSRLVEFLRSRFGGPSTEVACNLYQLGEVDGATIFWQIDRQGRVRSGKCITYGSDGHRLKDGGECGWVHARLKKDGHLAQDWELTQCFFGEHLLTLRPNADVCIVESEKTAVICSIVYPKHIWLASGGKYGLNADKMGALEGRKIIVYPDADAYDKWEQQVDKLKAFYDIRTIPQIFTEEQIANKYDIADLIIEQYAKH